MPKCVLCRSALDDELHLGKFHINRKVAVHQSCLYLSSNLVQRGSGRGHILYFRFSDILTEAERTKNVICCYCYKVGANISCCKKYCRRSFHTYCGINNGAQNQFVDTYKSFCHAHVSTSKKRPQLNEECAICFDQLITDGQKFFGSKYIHGKCCGKGWYHKDCLQRYADSAGYFFKCPLCKNSDIFRMVALWGVAVPDRDASWEEGDAFADQQVRPTVCTAKECVSSKPRNGRAPSLLYCIMCGSNPKHMACTTFRRDDYQCDDCFAMRNENSNACGNRKSPTVTTADANINLSDSNVEKHLDPLERIFSSKNSRKLSDGLHPCDTYTAVSASSKNNPNSSGFGSTASNNEEQLRSLPNRSLSHSDKDDDDDQDPLELLTSMKMPVNGGTTSPSSTYSGIGKENVGSNTKVPQERKPAETSARACASPHAQPYVESGNGVLRDRGQQATDTRIATRRIRSESCRTLPSRLPSSDEVQLCRRTHQRYMPYPTHANARPTPGRRPKSMSNALLTQAQSPMDISCVANRTRARARARVRK